MPTPLDAENRRLIAEMREKNVLGDLDPKQIDVSRGVMLVCCADGDQLDEVFDHMRDTSRSAGHKPRIHTLTGHGGALHLSPHCEPYPGIDVRELKNLEIEEGRHLKDIHTIVLSVHAPCGKAAAMGLNLVDLIGHMMAAKSEIKSRHHGVRVLCMIHVDYGDRKRSYTISRIDWARYRANGASEDHPRSLSAS